MRVFVRLFLLWQKIFKNIHTKLLLTLLQFLFRAKNPGSAGGMEQTVRQLQGDIPLEQQIIRNKIRSADKIQDHFSKQILERTQRVIFNIEIGGKLPAENLRAVFSIPVKCGRMKGFDTVIPGIF